MSLAADRNTPEREGRYYSRPVAANAKIYAGALVALNANGFAVPGSTAVGLQADGRADAPADNTGGVDGAIRVKVKSGPFYYSNSAGADLITQTSINGGTAYIVDDQTVALTNGGGTRSPAGKILDVDPALGVLVAVGILHA